MYLLTKQQAIQAMREGKTIGFCNIKGVEMWLGDTHFMFKHRCGKIEPLHPKTMNQDDGYCLVENTHKNVRFVFNKKPTLTIASRF